MKLFQTKDYSSKFAEISRIRLVTREMVYARTAELAFLAGRSAHQIKQLDYELAKRELTGESDFDKQQALLDLRELV